VCALFHKETVIAGTFEFCGQEKQTVNEVVLRFTKEKTFQKRGETATGKIYMKLSHLQLNA
jgi:hypothetical protein